MIVRIAAGIVWRSNLVRALVWRYFPHGRLRERVIARLFERIYDYLNQHGTAPARFLRPEFVLNQAAEALGTAGTYIGLSAPREMLDELSEDIRDLWLVCERVFEVPGERVVTLIRLEGMGPFSGIPISAPVAAVFTLRGGRVAQADMHYGHPEFDPLETFGANTA